MNNKEKKSAGGNENNKIVLLLVFMFLGTIFFVGIGADFLYKCNIIISICVPWMNVYEWVYGGALGLTLIKKYLFHSKCDIGEIWLKSLFFVSVIVIIIRVLGYFVLSNLWLCFNKWFRRSATPLFLRFL